MRDDYSERPRATDNADLPEEESSPQIETTADELQGFYIVRAILSDHVDINRVADRDTLSYFGILLDDNNRKPVCRLHFNRSQKYIGLFDENKKETRHPILHLTDIHKFKDYLVKTLSYYDISAPSQEAE